MIGTQEAAQSAETVRFIVIMVSVIAAFFWRALIRQRTGQHEPATASLSGLSTMTQDSAGHF